jgi:malonate transporter
MLVVLKNGLHPILIWFLATQVFDITPLWTGVALILSACPIGINTYLFAQRYQILVSTSAAATVLSTLASFFSLSVILWLLDVR